MLKKISAVLIVLIIAIGSIYFSNFAIQAASANSDEEQTIEPGDPFRYHPNDAFGIGEKFKFEINYGFINAGYATMEVAGLIEYEERPCYHIKSTANSNKFFSSFLRTLSPAIEKMLVGT